MGKKKLVYETVYEEAMKVFLIHDPLREDRHTLFTKELKEQGITDVEIVPAVKEYQNVQKNISEAHKNCIRRAVEEDLERVVVLEDDVKFACPGAYNEFLKLSEELPEGWDVFTAGSYDYKAIGQGQYQKEPFHQLHTFAGLHCYMVNKKFYQKLIDTPGVHNLDKKLRGSIWMCWPMMALQWDGYSANTKKVTNYNTVFHKKIKLWNNETL